MNSTNRRVYVLSAVLLACAAALTLRLGWGDVQWWAPPLMVLVVLVSESCNIRLQIGKHHWLVAFTESAISAA